MCASPGAPSAASAVRDTALDASAPADQVDPARGKSGVIPDIPAPPLPSGRCGRGDDRDERRYRCPPDTRPNGTPTSCCPTAAPCASAPSVPTTAPADRRRSTAASRRRASTSATSRPTRGSPTSEVDPPHPRRLRRPHGVRRAAGRRDGRRGPLRPLAAALRGRGRVLRRRRPPGPGPGHVAARVPGRGRPPGRHQRLHGHRPAHQPADGGRVPHGRASSCAARSRRASSRSTSTSSPPPRPRPRSRPGPGGPRPRPCACCWRPASVAVIGAGRERPPASGTRCYATCWPTTSTASSTR